MKIALILTTILFFIYPKTDFRLNGKYRVVSDNYEEEYLIIIHDSVYTKVMHNGKEIRGIVEYKNLIYLQDFESVPQIPGQKTVFKKKEDEIISLRDERKDTVSFCIHKNVKGTMNWLDICRGTGKLIKMK